jgi:hypothetical protein
MDTLIELGYQPADIPGDLTEPEAEALEIQALTARGDWEDAEERIDEFIVQHPLAPGHLRQLADELKRIRPSDEKTILAGLILRGLADAGRAKLGLKPRQKREEGEEI